MHSARPSSQLSCQTQSCLRAYSHVGISCSHKSVDSTKLHIPWTQSMVWTWKRPTFIISGTFKKNWLKHKRLKALRSWHSLTWKFIFYLQIWTGWLHDTTNFYQNKRFFIHTKQIRAWELKPRILTQKHKWRRLSDVFVPGWFWWYRQEQFACLLI